jgi:hypothetical protein
MWAWRNAGTTRWQRTGAAIRHGAFAGMAATPDASSCIRAVTTQRRSPRRLSHVRHKCSPPKAASTHPRRSPHGSCRPELGTSGGQTAAVLTLAVGPQTPSYQHSASLIQKLTLLSSCPLPPRHLLILSLPLRTKFTYRLEPLLAAAGLSQLGCLHFGPLALTRQRGREVGERTH